MDEKSVQTYMTLLRKNKSWKIKQQKKWVEKLKDLSKEEPESYENFFASVYEIDLILARQEFLEVAEQGKELCPSLKKKNYYDLVLKLQNIMAEAYAELGDARTALVCYFEAMDYAKMLHQQAEVGTIYFHIGQLYERLGDFEKAEQFMQQGIRLFMTAPEQDEQNPYTEGSYVSALVRLCCDAGGYKGAEKMLCLIGEKELYPEQQLLLSEIYMNTGRNEEAYKCLKEAQREMECEIEEHPNELVKIASGFLKLKKEKDCNKLLEIVKTSLDRYHTTKVRLRLQGWLVEYYRAFGTEEEQVKIYEQYRESLEKSNAEMVLMQQNHLHDREAYERGRRRNEQIANYSHRMKKMAEQDELTGVANRYGLNRKMSHYFQYCMEQKQTLSVVFIDVDYFKQYNDLYGHVAGDVCLQSVCACLKEEMGKDAVIARYGGDEFVALLCGKTEKEIKEGLKRIQSNLYAKNIVAEKSEVSDRVTVTIGVMHRIPQKGQKSEDFLKAADRILYKVKKKRRNDFEVIT